METSLDKQLKLVGQRKRTRPNKRQIQRIAENYFGKSALVWYSKADGWWLETDRDEFFLGCDSFGALRSVKEIVGEK
jgi:hypothetical protein